MVDPSRDVARQLKRISKGVNSLLNVVAGMEDLLIMILDWLQSSDLRPFYEQVECYANRREILFEDASPDD